MQLLEETVLLCVFSFYCVVY
uniref:Uncharacterized protein n=1 Tax=Anguilla anguilla TaxID=7936 RepID=A0A0E9XC49_ANGAN